MVGAIVLGVRVRVTCVKVDNRPPDRTLGVGKSRVVAGHDDRRLIHHPRGRPVRDLRGREAREARERCGAQRHGFERILRMPARLGAESFAGELM